MRYIMLVTTCSGLLLLPPSMRGQLDPHDPATTCNPRVCTCLGMVNKIQTTLSKRCWERYDPLGGLPDNPIVREMRQLDPPDKVKACLGEVPDHCEIMTHSHYKWPNINKNKNTCGKACRPDLCRCADSACKGH